MLVSKVSIPVLGNASVKHGHLFKHVLKACTFLLQHVVVILEYLNELSVALNLFLSVEFDPGEVNPVIIGYGG